MERNVADDAERLRRERHCERIVLDDLEAVAELRGEPRIDLDCDYAPGASRELGGEPAVAGADLDDQLVRLDVETANDVGGETPTAEKVL